MFVDFPYDNHSFWYKDFSYVKPVTELMRQRTSVIVPDERTGELAHHYLEVNYRIPQQGL